MRSPRIYSDCASARNDRAPASIAATTATATVQRKAPPAFISVRSLDRSRSVLLGALRDERGGLFVEIVKHGGEQGFALGRCRPCRIAEAAGAAVVRRVRVRWRQRARRLLFQGGGGFCARACVPKSG